VNKKAQGAGDLLLTYSWALLVFLIVIASLAHYVLFRPGEVLAERCIIGAGSGLFCEGFSAAPGEINLKLRNILPETVEITEASISQEGNSCSFTGSVNIPTGSSDDLILDGGGSSCLDLTSIGKRLKGGISITFTRHYLSKTTMGDVLVRTVGGYIGVEYDVCKNAADGAVYLCSGLDAVFGAGYRQQCCSEHSLCCS
jgi:hypothetical protein